MDDEQHTEGKFHIETFNKISPQVSAFSFQAIFRAMLQK